MKYMFTWGVYGLSNFTHFQWTTAVYYVLSKSGSLFLPGQQMFLVPLQATADFILSRMSCFLISLKTTAAVFYCPANKSCVFHLNGSFSFLFTAVFFIPSQTKAVYNFSGGYGYLFFYPD